MNEAQLRSIVTPHNFVLPINFAKPFIYIHVFLSDGTKASKISMGVSKYVCKTLGKIPCAAKQESKKLIAAPNPTTLTWSTHVHPGKVCQTKRGSKHIRALHINTQLKWPSTLEKFRNSSGSYGEHGANHGRTRGQSIRHRARIA